jgi:hypothetical protein
MQSTVWDGTYEVSSPINFNTPDLENPYYEADQGHEALPGKYFAQIIKETNTGTFFKYDELGALKTQIL